MKIRHTTSSGSDEVELQMTPMIDIVFQLLIFFVMTFKIVVQEGDFNVKMPRDGVPPKDRLDPPPAFRVTLTANDTGGLTQIGTPLGTLPVEPTRRANVLAAFKQLRDQVVQFVGPDTGPGSLREKAEAQIEADEHLHYVYVIDTVTHLSGYTRGNEVIKLLENIQFTPPQGSNRASRPR